jgi:hypothetical protein
MDQYLCNYSFNVLASFAKWLESFQKLDFILHFLPYCFSRSIYFILLDCLAFVLSLRHSVTNFRKKSYVDFI